MAQADICVSAVREDTNQVVGGGEGCKIEK